MSHLGRNIQKWFISVNNGLFRSKNPTMGHLGLLVLIFLLVIDSGLITDRRTDRQTDGRTRPMSRVRCPGEKIATPCAEPGH